MAAPRPGRPPPGWPARQFQVEVHESLPAILLASKVRGLLLLDIGNMIGVSELPWRFLIGPVPGAESRLFTKWFPRILAF